MFSLSLPRLLKPEARDPRHIVTPDAFEVAPEMLGRPLAAPWRRGVALLADLLLIFLLTKGGAIFFSVVAAVAFFIVATRKKLDRWWKRGARGALALAGSLLVFLAALAVLYEPPAEYAAFSTLSAGQWTEFGTAVGSQDTEVRATAAEKLVGDMLVSGAGWEQMQPIVDSLDLPPEVNASFQDMIAFGVSENEPEVQLAPAELAPLLEDYAAALREGDEAKANELLQPVEDAVAGGATGRLGKRVERLQTNIRELYGENRRLREEVENPSLMRTLSAAAADLGLSFGWGSVYFTLFLAWWRGRTPGKWLFGLRVLRLDDRPLTLFGAFERFAGYAAGLATGLFGFLQILWDPNRQGLQDKIVGTVVVHDRRAPKT